MNNNHSSAPFNLLEDLFNFECINTTTNSVKKFNLNNNCNTIFSNDYPSPTISCSPQSSPELVSISAPPHYSPQLTQEPFFNFFQSNNYSFDTINSTFSPESPSFNSFSPNIPNNSTASSPLLPIHYNLPLTSPFASPIASPILQSDVSLTNLQFDHDFFSSFDLNAPIPNNINQNINSISSNINQNIIPTSPQPPLSSPILILERSPTLVSTKVLPKTKPKRKQPTEKQFNCSYCTVKFLRKHDLKRHERHHLGIKPFTCTICLKQFTRADALTRHTQIPDGCKSLND
ncbi:hypothetical protein HK099_006779, partial [Clydaea vesicula]